MSIRKTLNGYVVTDDKMAIDIDAVHGFLRGAYWSPGIPRDVIEKAVAHSWRLSLLATRDARALYAEQGFCALDAPEIFMQISQPNIYNGAEA